MIFADDLLRRVHGTEVKYSVDLSTAEPPVKRVNSTMTGRRRNISKAQYQYMFHSDHEKLTKAEKRMTDYEDNGFLTTAQFADLRKVQDDPTISNQVRETLTRAFESARTDPRTEIPTAAITKKDKSRA